MKKPRLPTPTPSLDKFGEHYDQIDLGGPAPADNPPRPRDPGDLAAISMLEAAFAAHPEVRDLAGQGSAAIIVAVPPLWAKPVQRAWAFLMMRDGQIAENGDTFTSLRWRDPAEQLHIAFVREDAADARKTADGAAVVALALGHGGTAVGFAPDPETSLPAALLAAADATITLKPIDSQQLAEVIEEISGNAPTEVIADTIAAKISPDDLRLAVRAGQDANSAIRRLVAMIAKRQIIPDITLADLGGMEEAVTWGFSLANDLAEYRDGILSWSEVDRGVLLSGPPGCGKTTFARALAGSCGTPLIASSLGEWQAAGHLGDLLKAMRRTFEQARAAAPAILLVDEIDGFGDRANLSSGHKDYSVQVINGFLELLDGVVAREGIVVVGATNHPSRLDPAITRSGRLDRHITIGLPDEGGLTKILRHHLGDDLPGEDLSAAAKLALGGTGADAARWVRGAKRRGRQGARSMCMEDLIAEIRGNAPEVCPSILRRCAIHEAGHAIAIAVLHPATLRHVSIRQTWTTGGGVISQRPLHDLATSSDIDELLMILMAGRASEEIVLGSASSGAGGGVESDLAKATMLATSAITALGLGRATTPIWSGMPSPDTIDILLSRRPDIGRQVEARLDRAYGAAKTLITGHSGSLSRIVDRLIEVETLSGDEVLALLLPESPAPEQEAC
ncbi:AAA family ATPase [Paramagnetospirillum magneticum]|uniref:ATP-dependent Zn protease n=1 Tax=Paramagnetospirillum magneticum (strain ATCC 700264 / AMB-1) TaxID=342108 RepID=Q2W6N4_PARM1|nr:AAA family ATPase [Paramagnetospirillum magneticum]BAE50491.1 ATP-dependent Zn protease [Paramagnetospirillum magneticum AMB-1]